MLETFFFSVCETAGLEENIWVLVGKIVRQIGYISSSTKTCRGNREISSILQENKSGDFYFYCFNNLIELKVNAREKMEKS